MIYDMGDVQATEHWTDEDWRKTLAGISDDDLISLWSSVGNYNPCTYTTPERNAREKEIFRHAYHCMRGEILERMRRGHDE